MLNRSIASCIGLDGQVRRRIERVDQTPGCRKKIMRAGVLETALHFYAEGMIKNFLFLVAGLLFCLLGADAHAQIKKPGEAVSQAAGSIHARASTLVCSRPGSAAVPAHNVDVDRCHGNWMATDNTGNWHYQASPGPDHMVRNNGKPGDRSCMKCPNGGHLVQDAHGMEDWCVNTVAAVAAVPASTATPSCPSGFTLGPQ